MMRLVGSASFLLLLAEGSWAPLVSKRHMEIIDSLAALPPRKKVKGVSLELDAKKKFQEEGLAAFEGSTIRGWLRASAKNQGILNRNKIVTDAHRKIISELPAGTCGVKELFEIASRRFEEAGLEKICCSTIRKHLKTRDSVVMEEEEEEKQDVENPWFGDFASNENVVDSKKELSDIASIEFEKNQLNPVSFRTFGYNLDSAGLSCGYGSTFGRKEKARKSDKSKERFPEAIFQHRLLLNAVQVGESRKRMAQSSHAPALGGNPTESEEYELLKSTCECLGDDDAEDESLQSISEYEAEDDVGHDPSYGEVDIDESISDEHASYDSNENVPAILQHRLLVNAVPVRRVEEAQEITGKTRQKVHFTNAHKEVLRYIVGNKRGRRSGFDDEDLFAEASQAFEKNGLKTVSKRNFMIHLKKNEKDEEDKQDILLAAPALLSQQSDNVADSLTLDGSDLTEKQGMTGCQSEDDQEMEVLAAPRKGRKTISQAHLEIIDIVAKRRGSVAVAREMIQERGLEDFSIRTIGKYLKQARGRWQSQDDLVDQNSSGALSVGSEAVVRTNIITAAHEQVVREVACSSSGSIDDVFNLATEEFKRRDLVPVCYSSFLDLYYLKRKEWSVHHLPIIEKRVMFSDDHREVLLEFSHKNPAVYTEREKELLFREVSQEFENRRLKKVSRSTFMRHLKRNVADSSPENHDQPIMADDEEEVADAVSGLLFLRNGKA